MSDQTLLVAAIALALLYGLWWLWWRLPKWQAGKLDLTDQKTRADTEDNFRKTVGQALGGAALLIGAAAAYLQFTQQQQALQDLLISNQVAKGFEQLGSNEVATRLGGIYALEGVMNTSSEYHQPVLEALCAFVRDSTTRRPVTFTTGGAGGNISNKPAIDVRATLAVIVRRKPGPKDVVDLAGARIAGATVLQAANLSGARLNGADLSFANLRNADLNRSDLSDADLSDADLSGAVLKGADLSGADLTGAKNLAQDDLDQACGKPKAMPPGLTLDKPCP